MRSFFVFSLAVLFCDVTCSSGTLGASFHHEHPESDTAVVSPKGKDEYLCQTCRDSRTSLMKTIIEAADRCVASCAIRASRERSTSLAAGEGSEKSTQFSNDPTSSSSSSSSHGHPPVQSGIHGTPSLSRNTAWDNGASAAGRASDPVVAMCTASCAVSEATSLVPEKDPCDRFCARDGAESVGAPTVVVERVASGGAANPGKHAALSDLRADSSADASSSSSSATTDDASASSSSSATTDDASASSSSSATTDDASSSSSSATTDDASSSSDRSADSSDAGSTRSSSSSSFPRDSDSEALGAVGGTPSESSAEDSGGKDESKAEASDSGGSGKIGKGAASEAGGSLFPGNGGGNVLWAGAACLLLVVGVAGSWMRRDDGSQERSGQGQGQYTRVESQYQPPLV